MELYSEANTLDSLNNVSGFDSLPSGKYILEKQNGIFIPGSSTITISPTGGLENTPSGLSVKTDTASGLFTDSFGLSVKTGNSINIVFPTGVEVKTVNDDELRITSNGLQSELRSFIMFEGLINNNLQSASVATSNNATINSPSLGVFDINLKKGRYLCSYHFAKALSYSVTTTGSTNAVRTVNETYIIDCKEPNDKFVLTIDTPQASINGYFDIEITYVLPITQI